MKIAKDLFGYENLAVFGRINASISHELKNIMAIISETAGLLKDISDMASTGSPIDPDLLVSSADSIMEEIQRGFTTIRQMNRFAHTIDHPVATVNLLDVIDLVTNLSEYLTCSGRTHLNPCDGMEPEVMTCPFVLHAIIYHVLKCNFQHTGPGSELEIAIQPKDDSTWRIIFHGFSVKEFQVFPDDLLEKMAQSIGICIQWNRAADHMEMHIPLAIEGVV